MVQGFRFGDRVSRGKLCQIKVKGSGFTVYGSKCRVQGLGFGVQGFGVVPDDAEDHDALQLRRIADRLRVNSEQIRQPGPDSGLDLSHFQCNTI